MTPRLAKIITGGQTGVDRGALDAALEHRFPCGGWCPPGRLAEDGPIDSFYPLTEMKTGGYEERTRRNVEDADGTVVIYFGELEGGTALTVEQCVLRNKPYELINAEELTASEAAKLVVAFIETRSVSILNVAGPRESRVPSARGYSREVIGRVLAGARG